MIKKLLSNRKNRDIFFTIIIVIIGSVGAKIYTNYHNKELREEITEGTNITYLKKHGFKKDDIFNIEVFTKESSDSIFHLIRNTGTGKLFNFMSLLIRIKKGTIGWVWLQRVWRTWMLNRARWKSLCRITQRIMLMGILT